MRKLKILGYGKSLGNRKYTFNNQERYRISEEQDHFSLAIESINKALKKADKTIDDMDVIVFASAVGFQPIPCSAALISEKLNTTKPIPCMDINTSCTSFVAALDTMSYLIDAKRYNRVLIVTAEVASIGLNKKQKESYELFSDAGATFIFEREENKNIGVLHGLQKTYIEGAHHTEIRGGLSSYPAIDHNVNNNDNYLFDMKGKSVLYLASVKISEFIKDFEKDSGYKFTDFDKIIPHQASNALPIIMKRLKVPKEKYINKIEQYGNMVAASIPFILCHSLENNVVKEGDTILLWGTAAGLTISSLVIKI